MALKYFGSEPALGKTLAIDDTLVQVTGVLQNVPENSHIQFDFLLPYTFRFRGIPRTQNAKWIAHYTYTYVKLSDKSLIPQIESGLAERMAEIWQSDDSPYPVFMPLTDIHLYSHAEKELAPNSNIAYIWIFSAIAVFVLMIACINFMNLATARSANRAREVGMRKVLGAKRPQLIGQFIGEALILTATALLLGIVLLLLFLPIFNDVSGKTLAFNLLNPWWMPLFLTGIIAGVAFLAGSYPALYLSAFRPVAVLKGSMSKGAKNSLVRKSLVVTQFGISIFLIIGTLIIRDQLTYLQNESLGLEKEQIMVIPMQGRGIQNDYLLLKNELTRLAQVQHVTASSSVPGKRVFVLGIKPEGFTGQDSVQSIRSLLVDFDFTEAYGLEFVSGRTFRPEIASDSNRAFILNEAAAKMLGWEDPLGKEMVIFREKGPVIGTVKDFNYASLHTTVEPLVIHRFTYYNFVSVKLNTANLAGSLSQIETVWQTIFPNRPFDFYFLDDGFDKLYQAEQTLTDTFGYFTFLAIFIACLGLFGLAAFTADQRTREIGIRKTLGASVSSVILLLSKEFAQLVAIAFLFTAPLAYFVMNHWLQDFAYRIDLHWFTFLMAGVAALLIAILTVSYQAVKAALTNPVEALRHE